ncbi:hypothetical protein Zmor_023259 [Zophobas morio]|uniref:EGF-like domain-containing protein n=1 Tax=Zophobas morio TaxID=2755281 RepID=A0AA38HZ25_9CUCU|nr:hypothetical protein Zmor_023259 [Zophobas morio]
MVRSIAGSVDSPTISGKINGRESKIIIDTGAEVSLARRSRLQNCQIKSVYTATNVKTVTGETTPVLGTAVVNVELGRLRIRHEVLVAEIADDFILGMDLISRYGLMIDPEQKILRFGAEEFVLGRPNVEAATVRLVVCQTTKVDGNTEVIVPARVETNPGYSLGMVQPASDSTHKLLIASTLVKTDRDIPIRVANVFPNAVNIRKGEIIGMCEPVARVLNCEEEDVENESKEGDTKGLEVNWNQLSARERKLAKGLIRRHRNVFASEEEPFGKTNIVEHRINTGDTQPIRQAPRRLPLAKQEEATKLVDNMLRDGVIEESNSAWRPCGECKHCDRIDAEEGNLPVRRTIFEQDEEWTTARLKREQEADDIIGPILKWKEEGVERPGWAELSDQSPSLKALWAQWDSLVMENGLLKRKWESPDGRTSKTMLVLPKIYVGNLDKCAGFCGNGGVCQILSPHIDPICQCPPTWTGPRCESLAVCSNYCKNGATCDVSDGLPFCRCPDGFEGVKCDQLIVKSLDKAIPQKDGGRGMLVPVISAVVVIIVILVGFLAFDFFLKKRQSFSHERLQENDFNNPMYQDRDAEPFTLDADKSGNFANPVYDSVYNSTGSGRGEEKAVLLQHPADEAPTPAPEEI